MQIPAIAHDKLLHYFWGGVVAIAGLLVALLLAKAGRPVPWGPEALGALACAAIALGREAWNAQNGGRWSNADILATLLGGAAALGPAYLI